MIDAVDRRPARLDPAGEDHLIECLQIVCCNIMIEFQGDAGDVNHPTVIAERFIKLLFTGDLFGNIELPADLAQRIKDAQGPEIDRMNSWLETWGASDMSGMDHGASMDGMLSEEDLQALEAADGPTASKLFLQQMIEHHEGAVKMAETQLSEGKNPDALELAQQIIDAQTVEIQEMRDLLDTL